MYDNAAAQSGGGPSHMQGGHAEVLLTPGDYFRNNPAEQAQYFRKNKLRPTFLHQLQVLGYSKSTQARYIEHWEEPMTKETFKIGSVVTAAGGVGQEIILAIHADDMYSWSDDQGGTQYGSRPRKTETFIMSDRNEYRITDKNEGVNPHRITVKPTDDGVNANTALTAGATAFIIGPIKAEATGQVKGLTPRVYKYTNTFAIVDDTDLVSGTVMTIKSPFKAVPGKPAYFYLRGFADAEVRHERSKGLRGFFGRTMDNASDYSEPFGKTFKIKGTEGFLQFVTSYGLDDPFANLGAYSMDDLTGLTTYFSDLQLPYGDIFVAQGSEIAAKTDNLLKDFVSDTTVSYVAKEYMGAALKAAQMNAPQYNEKKLFVNFGFKGIHYGGYNLLFTSVNEMNLSVPGLKQTQIAGPMGLFNDKKTDDSTPIMGYEYRSNPEIGYSRENEIWRRGGAGPAMVNKTSEFDVAETFLRSEFGMHFSHGQWYVYQHPLA